MFWGLIFIALGTLLVIKHVFGIHLPIFKILIGLGLIYIGCRIIFGSFHLGVSPVKTENLAIFAESQFSYSSVGGKNDYQAIFGSADLDLSQVDLSQQDVKINLGAVFGHLTVLVDPGTPLVVKANSAFGKVRLPSKDRINFGEYTYESQNSKTAPHKLILEANAVFGDLEIRFR